MICHHENEGMISKGVEGNIDGVNIEIVGIE
jgi:hypothetical protein